MKLALSVLQHSRERQPSNGLPVVPKVNLQVVKDAHEAACPDHSALSAAVALCFPHSHASRSGSSIPDVGGSNGDSPWTPSTVAPSERRSRQPSKESTATGVARSTVELDEFERLMGIDKPYPRRQRSDAESKQKEQERKEKLDALKATQEQLRVAHAAKVQAKKDAKEARASAREGGLQTTEDIDSPQDDSPPRRSSAPKDTQAGRRQASNGTSGQAAVHRQGSLPLPEPEALTRQTSKASERSYASEVKIPSGDNRGQRKSTRKILTEDERMMEALVKRSASHQRPTITMLNVMESSDDFNSNDQQPQSQRGQCSVLGHAGNLCLQTPRGAPTPNLLTPQLSGRRSRAASKASGVEPADGEQPPARRSASKESPATMGSMMSHCFGKRASSDPQKTVEWNLEGGQTYEPTSVKLSPQDSQSITMAKRYNMSVADAKAELAAFKAIETEGTGLVNKDDFLQEARKRFHMGADERIPPHLMRGAEDPLSEKKGLSVDDFFQWWTLHQYAEEVLVSDKDDRMLRKISTKYGVDLLTIEGLRRDFDRFDKNNNGALCKEEFKDVLREHIGASATDIPAESLQRLWREIDRNGDGSVSLEEFCIWYCERYPPGH
eukprot:TRINITY_DN16100_c0_g1_i1.p1 TRINITY_DN16100_c0_g1~~TRINITY_DN16100_c0_g1_i1.p1  ORF type:complete len:611 (+),score=129.47 TRINITY_DN16100_c0_g1_i1:120-1952(+)